MLCRWTSHQEPTIFVTSFYRKFSALFNGASLISVSGVLREIFMLLCCNVHTFIYNEVNTKKCFAEEVPTENPHICIWCFFWDIYGIMCQGEHHFRNFFFRNHEAISQKLSALSQFCYQIWILWLILDKKHLNLSFTIHETWL